MTDWARLWKQTAKRYRKDLHNYRTMADDVLFFMLPFWRQRYYRVSDWAALWKRAAKRHRCNVLALREVATIQFNTIRECQETNETLRAAVKDLRMERDELKEQVRELQEHLTASVVF